MKKKLKAPPKKKAAAKKTKPKTRRKSAVTANTPRLVVTVLSDCTLANNQNLNPPHACKSGNGGFPNHVQFKGDIVAWFCLPAGYLTPEPAKPLQVGPGNPSPLFRVVSNPPTPAMLYHHSCNKPCVMGADVNGDEILIDA